MKRERGREKSEIKAAQQPCCPLRDPARVCGVCSGRGVRQARLVCGAAARERVWRGREGVMASLSETIVNTIQVWPARPSRARPCRAAVRIFLAPGARRPLAAGGG